MYTTRYYLNDDISFTDPIYKDVDIFKVLMVNRCTDFNENFAW